MPIIKFKMTTESSGAFVRVHVMFSIASSMNLESLVLRFQVATWARASAAVPKVVAKKLPSHPSLLQENAGVSVVADILSPVL